MIDRALGIVGLAVAFLTGAAQRFFPSMPQWVENIGYAFGVLLIGVSIGLISAGGLRGKRLVKPSALLRLHIYGDHRVPDRVALDNIFRWYFFHTAFDGHSEQGVQRLATFCTLLVTFEDDVVIHTLSVRSPDMQLPRYEVKEFNQRYALIVFSDNVPAGTLEVNVSS